MQSTLNRPEYAAEIKGNYVPGLIIYNTFLKENRQPWWQKHLTLPILIAVILLGYFLLTVNWDFNREARERMFDEMAVTVVDFGDFVPFAQRRGGGSYVEIDEVFGNQYIKDKTKEYVEGRDIIDPRIGTAVNPVISNATAPIDLEPHIIPGYTERARSAGIEGTVVLELIISDEGEVLRAKVVSKKLGYGLDQSAVETYEKKKFKPSINSDGKRITVKIYQPVRYRLF